MSVAPAWQDCLSAGLGTHAWGPWAFARVDDHEIRFCVRCNVMEQQSIQPVWERCINCEQDYVYGHLCREHMLCGVCHPLV